MPVLARFYGIVIKMYLLDTEHNPPHIHAIYGDDAAAFDIRTGEILDGGLPARAIAMVHEWISKNEEDLLQIWETQQFKKLEPLN